MPLRSSAFARQKLCLDFASLKHANLKGLYVSPVPDEPLQWTAVLSVRKGPYASALLRLSLSFPASYPSAPPAITFAQDVFHPLVAPLTTYTLSSARDSGPVDPRSRLPPGGLVLREGFPEWFAEESESEHGDGRREPHIVEVLHYVRLLFCTPELLDAVPLEAAANPSAWHAWRSYRARVLGEAAPVRVDGGGAGREGSAATQQQQPGGARRPGEWNWSGVWEDRVRKVVAASRAEGVLFGGEGGEVISFAKMDDEALASVMPQIEAVAAGG
ncbi:hypothetical protein WHR41_05419 [Cladosporium halotolerans]|uniref:UBC core domain-containing protein n=1 Tax=Cladosporium halotolerans TaxID=1052096 RepID=A0AB34KNE4_9PEZI